MSNKVFGYARCSTDESRQDIDRQKRELISLGVTDDKCLYWEYMSGVRSDRPEFQKILDIIEPGDTIIATEVSRLTRSTKDLCEILRLVQEKRIRLVIGSFIVDCRKEDISPTTKGALLMWGVYSEMERDIISQRVKSGMVNARIKGKKIGRPKMDAGRLPSKFLQFLPLYRSGKLSITDFSKVIGCSRTTVYAYLRVIGQ